MCVLEIAEPQMNLADGCLFVESRDCLSVCRETVCVSVVRLFYVCYADTPRVSVQARSVLLLFDEIVLLKWCSV